MFLRYPTRKKNGQEHRYYRLVENRRLALWKSSALIVLGVRRMYFTGLANGRGLQRHALYLGEINDRPPAAWRKTLEIFEAGQTRSRPGALFPEDRCGALAAAASVRIRLSQLARPRPRQWGAGWRAGQLWEQVGLDRFWAARRPPSRTGPRWEGVLPILVP